MARIVLVEDDAAIAKVIEINLRKRGHTEVKAYSSLEEARKRLKDFTSAPFELAIVDMVLRKPNGTLDPEAGIVFCGLLRDDEHTRHLPIITTSAYADPEQVEKLRQFSNRHLIKPLTIRELLAAVDELLRQTERGGGTQDKDQKANGKPQGAD